MLEVQALLDISTHENGTIYQLTLRVLGYVFLRTHNFLDNLSPQFLLLAPLPSVNLHIYGLYLAHAVFESFT